MLDAQQLALKLVANVTYGYTAANWSGRMPCDVVAVTEFNIHSVIYLKTVGRNCLKRKRSFRKRN